MPDGPLFEIDVPLRVEAGDLAVLTGTAASWAGIDDHEPRLRGDDISAWSHDVRLQAGLFVTSGHPAPVPGIRTLDLVHRMVVSGTASERQALATDWCDRLDLDHEVVDRPLDTGFTPAEGTSVELLHLALLRPDVAVIDLCAAASCDEHRAATVRGVQQIRIDQPGIGVVVVTNDDELIAGLTPDYVTTHASVDTPVGQAHRDEKLL